MCTNSQAYKTEGHSSSYIHVGILNKEQIFKSKYTQVTIVMFFFAEGKAMLGGMNTTVSTQPVALLSCRLPVNQQGGALPRSGKAVT